MEAWKVVDGGLVSDGIVKDVCPVLPVVLLWRIEELLSFRSFTGYPYLSISWVTSQLFGRKLHHSERSYVFL
jgi:hypothetical protein